MAHAKKKLYLLGCEKLVDCYIQTLSLNVSENYIFRKTPSHQAARPHLEDQPADQQYGGDLGQTRRVCPRPHMDLEGSQLWISWLHEDHKLRGTNRHLQRCNWHAGLLRGQLGWRDKEDLRDNQTCEHGSSGSERGWLSAALVPMVSRLSTGTLFNLQKNIYVVSCWGYMVFAGMIASYVGDCQMLGLHGVCWDDS